MCHSLDKLWHLPFTCVQTGFCSASYSKYSVMSYIYKELLFFIVTKLWKQGCLERNFSDPTNSVLIVFYDSCFLFLFCGMLFAALKMLLSFLSKSNQSGHRPHSISGTRYIGSFQGYKDTQKLLVFFTFSINNLLGLYQCSPSLLLKKKKKVFCFKVNHTFRKLE